MPAIPEDDNNQEVELEVIEEDGEENSPNELQKVKPKKASPKWISATDLTTVVEIFSKTDGIPPEEVVNSLNKLVTQGRLVIVPQLGAKLS